MATCLFRGAVGACRTAAVAATSTTTASTARLAPLASSQRVQHRHPLCQPARVLRTSATGPGEAAAVQRDDDEPAAPEPRSAPHPAVQADASVAFNSDEAIVSQLTSGLLKQHQLEKELSDCTRAADVRRQYFGELLAAEGRFESQEAMEALPLREFDHDGFYGSIEGANCEAVIGYVPVPVGAVGPLVLDNEPFRVPLATTEGALVASTNRGCRAIALAGGATTAILGNGMTRAPLLRVGSVAEAAALKAWVETPANMAAIKAAFDSTTRFGRLKAASVRVAGRNVYVRFSCFTGDAMGMNMVTKGAVAALAVVQAQFPDAKVVSLSGNVCADKKPSAVNWIEGRGRSVAVDVVLPRAVVEGTLKTTVDALVRLNQDKNLVGSALAGSLGGFNAHASNIVSAVFLATGNDIAQNVESATCITLMEREGDDLHVSVTMPSIEVGTVGGGTSLPAQRACLGLVGCAGASRDKPGHNADVLARVVAGSVLAGEISLMSALASGDLLKAHLDLNRKPTAGSSSSSGVTAAAPGTTTAEHVGCPSTGGPAFGSPMPTFNTTPTPMNLARQAGEHAHNVASRFHNLSGAGPTQQHLAAAAGARASSGHHTQVVHRAPAKPELPAWLGGDKGDWYGEDISSRHALP